MERPNRLIQGIFDISDPDLWIEIIGVIMFIGVFILLVFALLFFARYINQSVRHWFDLPCTNDELSDETDDCPFCLGNEWYKKWEAAHEARKKRNRTLRLKRQLRKLSGHTHEV